MKVKKPMLFILVCMISISGCVDSGTVEDEMTISEPSPEAATLFYEFNETDSYKEWSIWPGKGLMMDGTGVHGDYVSIYVSSNALASAEIGGSAMPYETMVVKEGFNADKELTGIYLMYKVEGFDPEHNDWFWAAYSPEGNVRSEGKVGGCISCHEGKKDVDYIFVNA